MCVVFAGVKTGQRQQRLHLKSIPSDLRANAASNEQILKNWRGDAEFLEAI